MFGKSSDELNVHFHHHFDADFYGVLNNILKENKLIMATLQDISNAVTAETVVDNSIVTLLNGIVAQLQQAQASNDPAAMDAVVANIQANTKILSDAVTANTPVSTSPTPTPAPVVTTVS